MLSYGAYTGIIYGVFLSLFIIYILIFTFLIPIRDYVNFLKHLFNIEINVIADGSSKSYIINIYGENIDIKKSIGFRFHLSTIVGLLLTFITMTFFVGCIVTMEYYYSGDPCPNRSKDCFVFGGSYKEFSPIDQFVCNLGEIIKIPNSTSYRYVLCFGYALDGQSTLDIMNQLGICTGILSLLSILVIFLHRISYHICGIIIIIILYLGSCVTMILFVLSTIKPDFLRITLVATTMYMCFAVFTLKSLIRCYRDSKSSSSV